MLLLFRRHIAGIVRVSRDEFAVMARALIATLHSSERKQVLITCLTSLS